MAESAQSIKRALAAGEACRRRHRPGARLRRRAEASADQSGPLDHPRPAPIARNTLADERDVLAVGQVRRTAGAADLGGGTGVRARADLRPQGPRPRHRGQAPAWPLGGAGRTRPAWTEHRGAHDALADFVSGARDRGMRCVRVIHGKGLTSPNREPVPQGQGAQLARALGRGARVCRGAAARGRRRRGPGAAQGQVLNRRDALHRIRKPNLARPISMRARCRRCVSSKEDCRSPSRRATCAKRRPAGPGRLMTVSPRAGPGRLPQLNVLLPK